MKMNYCPNCGTAVHGQIRFCSKCGQNFADFTEAKKADVGEFKGDFSGLIKGFLESNAHIIKDLAEKIENGEPFEQGMFFAVEMKGDKPVVKQGKPEEFEKIFKNLSSKPSFKRFMSRNEDGEIEFIEVQAVLRENAKRRTVEVELPEITVLEDVSILPYDGGIEVTAKKGRRIYFSKIQIDGSFTVGPSRLNEGRLLIEIK